MPILTIHMLEGRTKEQKRKLIEKVADTVVETLDTPPEAVRIIINEMVSEHYGVAGLPVNEYRVKKIKGD